MSTAPPIPEPPTTEPKQPVPAPKGLTRVLLTVVAAVAGLIVVGVGVVILSGDRSEPPTPSAPSGPSPPTTISNATTIAIPSAGPGAPYPSAIEVTDMRGVLTNVTVTLDGFTHAFPVDVEVLLVGPDGASVGLMEGVGGFDDAIDLRLTFDDDGPAIKASRQVVSGTFRPSSDGENGPGFGGPPPAPDGPHGTALSVFDGTDPNGVWQLFVFDGSGRDGGRISGGWALSLELGAASAGAAETTDTTSPSP